MKSIHRLSHPIIHFFENRSTPYVNHHQTEICLHSDYSLSVSSNFPGYVLADCKLFRHFQKITAFVRLFSSDRADALENISPEICSKLFEEGEFSVWCMGDPYLANELLFTFNKKCLFAFEEDTGKKHLVTSLLKAPEDYIHYTQEYYSYHDLK